MVTESDQLICEHIHMSTVQIRTTKRDTVSGDKKNEQCKEYKQMRTQILKKKMEFSLCLTDEFISL